MSWKKDIEELKKREKLAEEMGGEEKLKRQRDNNRLNVRERINLLFDKDTFHEIGKIAGKSEYNEKGELVTVFKNATYWSNELHWNLAMNPNDRERASFLQENLVPMKASGQLDFIKNDGIFLPGFDVLFAHGHTESQMIPHIKYKGSTIVFAADLLPSVGHIPLPYVMGYDTRPLTTLKEKKVFLETVAKKGYTLFLEHDYYQSCCTLKETDKGIRLDKSFQFEDKF